MRGRGESKRKVKIDGALHRCEKGACQLWPMVISKSSPKVTKASSSCCSFTSDAKPATYTVFLVFDVDAPAFVPFCMVSSALSSN